MSYIIKQMTAPVDWSQIEAMPIDRYSWGCSYRPEANARVAFVPGEGFYIRTACKEENPRATYTVPNSPVCRDSCLEFFASFDSARPDLYMNFECNANGCLLCEFGPYEGERSMIDKLGCEMPKPVPYRDGAYWGWELLVSLELLNKLYGKLEFRPGTKIRANAYKCGDDTEVKHYGSWQPIDWPFPSFHRPQFFGDLVIE